ncbi:DUF6734 family protein [Terriglobus roseus]|uniref:DUF6734 domain-containing protein n=1 Tax=Terriglobus roseus TaxID=392734 RepID=A0A1H4IX84_9BACT|nr:DUF6734 family protein [Terriglobus roseus]SEB38679.1 hypothetical protein SAMN05443244_0173 [Terriglobus roseus]
MRAVFSFWSKPFTAYKGRIWATPMHHLLAWGLSVRLAQQHFDEVVLVTDKAGKSLLVDRLGLKFNDVSEHLQEFRDVDPGWWAFGKLVAYSMQTKPFCHIDNDVFLWKPLPPALLSSPVFTQCPEYHHTAWEWSGPGYVEEAFEAQHRKLPAEWTWARSLHPERFCEDNCGILGGTDVAFLQYFSTLAIELVTQNAPAWDRFSEKEGFNMIVEQFLLNACVRYHRAHPQSPFARVRMGYLFPSFEQAYEEDRAARAGFTHLLGDAKSHPAISRRLEERMQWESPDFYRHCMRLHRNGHATA